MGREREREREVKREREREDGMCWNCLGRLVSSSLSLTLSSSGRTLLHSVPLSCNQEEEEREREREREREGEGGGERGGERE